MSTDPLLLTMLAVSFSSLVLQSAGLAHLLRQHASYDAERRAGNGYVRTAACRVAAAAIYTTVAALQVAGVHLGTGTTLSTEALAVFIAVQLIWGANTLMDIWVRRQLRNRSGNLAAALERKG